jgi:hypothetical protein
MISAFGFNDSSMIPIRCRAETFKIKGRVSAVPAATSAVIEQDPAFKTLLAVETEKAGWAKRGCNVIISGLPVQDNVGDVNAFVEFCNENLTIKPRLIRESCRRLGKSTTERPASSLSLLKTAKPWKI